MSEVSADSKVKDWYWHRRITKGLNHLSDGRVFHGWAGSHVRRLLSCKRIVQEISVVLLYELRNILMITRGCL